MVQSKFNLAFWFMSYNIFFLLVAAAGPRLSSPLSAVRSLLVLGPATGLVRTVHHAAGSVYLAWADR
jgi:hypothetical protein